MNPSIVRAAMRLAGLASLALLAEPLSGLADTAAAGRMGVAEQGALALGAGIITTTTWLLTPLMFAQTTEIARLRVAGDHVGMRRAVRRSLALAGAWGIVLACGIVLFAILAVDDGDARGYLLVRAAGLPVSAVVLAGYGALRGGGWIRDVSVLALTGAAVHVGTVVVVTSADLGVTGLGTASGLSQLVVAVIGLRALMFRGLWSRDGSGRASGSTEWRSSITAVGLLAARSAMLGGATVAMTTAAVHAGTDDAAAHLVVYQVWLLAVLVVEGWKSAAQILVSSSVTDQERRITESTVLRASVVLGALAAVAVLLVRPVAVGELSASPAVADIALSIWWLSAVSFVVGAVAFTRDGVEFGWSAYGTNVVRIAVGTVITVGGAAITYVTGDLVWMWIGMPLGLLVRAVWPYRAAESVRMTVSSRKVDSSSTHRHDRTVPTGARPS